MSKNIILALVFVFVVTISCNIPADNPDPFYSAWVDSGVPRFPLIKPYAAFYDEQNSKWSIKLYAKKPSDELLYYLGINDVEKISIYKGVIMVYNNPTPKNNPDDSIKSLYLFVLIPSQETERGFDNEPDFLNFIGTYEVEEVSWETPDDLNRKFLDTGCLEWIPGCQKEK
jgi:hypothetical protein